MHNLGVGRYYFGGLGLVVWLSHSHEGFFVDVCCSFRAFWKRFRLDYLPNGSEKGQEPCIGAHNGEDA